MIEILCTIILGVLLLGIWFGLNVVLNIISSKAKIEFIGKYSAIFSALLPTIFILKYSTLQIWNIRSVTDWRGWLVISMTVLVTSSIVSLNEVSNLPEGKELLRYAMEGVFMEVPQRMKMQSFVCILCVLNGCRNGSYKVRVYWVYDDGAFFGTYFEYNGAKKEIRDY